MKFSPEPVSAAVESSALLLGLALVVAAVWLVDFRAGVGLLGLVLVAVPFVRRHYYGPRGES